MLVVCVLNDAKERNTKMALSLAQLQNKERQLLLAFIRRTNRPQSRFDSREGT